MEADAAPFVKGQYSCKALCGLLCWFEGILYTLTPDTIQTPFISTSRIPFFGLSTNGLGDVWFRVWGLHLKS